MRKGWIDASHLAIPLFETLIILTIPFLIFWLPFLSGGGGGDGIGTVLMNLVI